MNTFYHNLHVAGVERHEAFVRAVHAVRSYKATESERISRRTLRMEKVSHLSKPRYPYNKPYYWASFIMID